MKRSRKARTNSKYKTSNKDKISDSDSVYYAQNKAAIRARQTAYEARNRSTITKKKHAKYEKKDKVLQHIFYKFQVVNDDDDFTALADPDKLKEAVGELGCRVGAKYQLI